MRIACVLAEGFEDSEFRKPYDAFRHAGHQVTVIGKQAGTELAGKAGREKARPDRGIGDVSDGDFAALFIPVATRLITCVPTTAWCASRAPSSSASDRSSPSATGRSC